MGNMICYACSMETSLEQLEVAPDFFSPDQEFLGTKGLVFVGDTVLVYRRDNNAPTHKGELDVPGGARDGRESPWETFQRETQEEFGLVVNRENIAWARAYPNTSDPTQIAYFAAARLPETAAENIRFGNEGIEYYRMPLASFLAATDAWPAYQKRARDFAQAAGLA